VQFSQRRRIRFTVLIAAISPSTTPKVLCFQLINDLHSA
jgi:hypothetical protein